MAEKEEVEEPTAPFWMATYGDMVTLILCFFILLVSYSTIELEKFRGAMNSLKGALGIFSGHESPQTNKRIKLGNDGANSSIDEMEQKKKDLEEQLEQKGLDEDVEVELIEEGMLIRIRDRIIFGIGKAKIKRSALPVLDIIADIIGPSSQEVYVEGHTDNSPIRTTRFPSNWELSSARALSVVKYFFMVKKIPERHLAAVGHGEYRPLFPNDSRENRAKNRRVEILIKE